MKSQILFLLSCSFVLAFPQEPSFRLRYITKTTAVQQTSQDNSRIIGQLKPKDKVFIEYTLGKTTRVEFYAPNGKLLSGYIPSAVLTKTRPAAEAFKASKSSSLAPKPGS
jgi:hypothetical protein